MKCAYLLKKMQDSALERKQKKKIIYKSFKNIDNTKIIRYQNNLK
jgi:hypothetical protein